MKPCDAIFRGMGQLATATSTGGPRAGRAQGEILSIDRAAMAVSEGRVAAVGPETEILAAFQGAEEHDLGGRVVLPGFVDAHTHLVYSGSREHEWARRLQGVSYAEIAQGGGGILYTVRQTRRASLEDLVAEALPRLDRALLGGTTTMEIKSGYGLSLDAERKQLLAVAELRKRHPMDLVATFMGAHEYPEEFRDNRPAYVQALCDSLLPELRSLAEFCDIFCESHVFNLEDSRRILLRAKDLGYGLKIHADELTPLGGAELAAEVGAISAEHLICASEAGIARLAAAGTIAVLLPATSFYLRCAYAKGRSMIDAGVPVALATDSNPGSAFTESMPFCLTTSCLYQGLRPAEALVAATYNAAWAIGRGREVGSLEVGKKADFTVWDAARYEGAIAHFGQPRIRAVYKAGRKVAEPLLGPRP